MTFGTQSLTYRELNTRANQLGHYLIKQGISLVKITPDTQGAGSGNRLCSSGIEYLGPIDYQVKIRGFRIELGEIEAQLSQHEAIREVVVVLQNEPIKRLVAYYVPIQHENVSNGHQMAKEAVSSRALRAYLAGYKANEGVIGVYAGVGTNTYFLNNLYPNQELVKSVGLYRLMLDSDKGPRVCPIS